MDSYDIARADFRIRELETEMRQIKLDTDSLKANIRRLESNAKPEPSFPGIFFTGFLWAIPAAAFGLLFGGLIGRALKALLS